MFCPSPKASAQSLRRGRARQQPLKRLGEDYQHGLRRCSAARLVNRDFNLTPEGAECSVELLESSCMVQAKEPID